MTSKLFLYLNQQWHQWKIVSLALGITIICTGCATKDTDSDESAKKGLSYDVSADVKLTPKQTKILYSKGELDKKLPKKAMPAVAKQYSHFLNKGRVTMSKFSQRAEDYLGHARDVFRARGMPEELAFLAIVESGYNTTISSHAGASGAWQFMPYTGKRFGLHQDWWIDERLDPYESVEAAATYLQILHDKFDDWLLAIAAYNAGEGKIERALKGTGAKDFFTLVERNYKLDYKAQLRKETIDYVPRFLAVTKIMRNLDALGFKDINMEQDAEFARVEAKPGTDLKAVAQAVNMPWTEFKQVNSAHKQFVTHASKHTYIYVPPHNTKRARSYIASGNASHNWDVVTVPKGTTWGAISKKSNVPVAALVAANGNKSLKSGAKIRVPKGPKVRVPKFTSNIALAYSGKAGTYKIRPGETLSGIAAKHNTTTKALMQSNNITDASKIRSGQVLKIPSSKAIASNSRSTSAKSSKKKNSSKSNVKITTKTHTVKPGETLLGIALKYGSNTKTLMKANNISDASKVRSGQVLKIPSTKSVAQSSKPKQKFYTVKSGDTYWDIARKYNLSTSELLALNKKSKSSTLRAGENLLVSVH